MKYKDLIKQLQLLGWYLKRQGSRHEIWSDGEIDEAIPRHKEINELLAKKIIKTARTHRKDPPCG